MQIFQPRVGRELLPSDAALFWRRVARGHPMDCWPWLGHRSGTGYGAIVNRVGGRERLRLAHRVAYEMSGGTLAPGLVIMHTCDNPPCCNPSHLRQGTYSENTLDSVAKGRWRGCGQRKARCRLGHEIDPPDTSKRQSACSICARIRYSRAYREARRGLRAGP